MRNSFYNVEKMADKKIEEKRKNEELEMIEETIRSFTEDPLKNGLTEEQMFLIKYYGLNEELLVQKNVNISNIIGICEKEFNIETIEVFYADKILKYRRYKLLSSYRDYNGIEFYNDENENIIKYRCPLENGIVVEYRKGKYNVFNMDCEDKEKLSYFIKEADKVIDFIMAENRILW